ncbi:Amidohydrolase [Gimesia maris]|uniref:amidohydrolase family protein n=1 Tax=Gimesia maris TaxID=122 RepID=UPI00118AC634|nr:amidohydrolase family protein [Gimesia maris]QDT80739.1 Amidohydrolase [Gimesia maris]
MIWDLHCHLSGVDGKTVDERIAQLMVYADRMGVERLIFFMGWPFLTDPTPEQFRKQNDQVLQAISHWHNRAFGFVYLNAKYVEESISELDRCVKNGPMIGVKLWVASRCNDPEIDPIIKRAAELNALIYQHTWYKTGGNLIGESTPGDLALMAKRHPDVPLICGHTGGDYELGLRAIQDSPNVYAGIGGSDPTAGITEMAVRTLGADRVLYGSDIGGRSFSSQLAKVQGADIPEVSRRLILGGNLKRLLTPILKEKGIKV